MKGRNAAPRTALALVFGLAMAAVSATAQQAAPQLFVTSAAPDVGGETISIAGGNFGPRPFVTLDMVPLPIRVAIDTQIIAEAPVKVMPPREYLLTVSRGPSAVENGSFQLTLGVVEPKRTPAPTDSRGNATAFSAAGDESAAQVGDRVITLAELDREWQRTDPASYVGLSRRLYDLRRRVADTLITDELLAREAAARGVTAEALLKEEVPKRVVPMPDSAVTSLYQGLGDSTRGATLDQMRPAIREWLARNTEPELAKMSYIEELKKVSTRAEMFLVAPRVQVERSAQDATLGPTTAPGEIVEIVVFGDFQSTEYARLAQAFGSVRDTFGDRIRFVFKHLPALGPESLTAAEAAQCANAQGRFWPYHDAMLAQPGTLSARLKQSATVAGLDRSAFDACVDRGEYRSVIRQALDEAERYDIQASPSFLFNGRLAPAPPPFLSPFDFFKRSIEEELGRLAGGRR
jgi:protein-disulfide isomerase